MQPEAMIEIVAVPTTGEQWQAVYQQALKRYDGVPGPLGHSIVSVILGDAWLKQTVDFLREFRASDDLTVLEPIEKLLITVNTPELRRYLLELCFSNDSAAVGVACLLLPSLHHYDLWPHLPVFDASDNEDVRWCGLALCREIAQARLVSSAEILAAADMFSRPDNRDFFVWAVEDLHAAAARRQQEGE